MTTDCAPATLKRKTDAWVLGTLLLLTLLVYLGTLPKEFTNWDDKEYVVSNPLIRAFSLENLNRIITEPYFANYAPLTLLSYALDYRLWKLNPTGYHFHSVALHLGCIVALYALLTRLKLRREVVVLAVCIFALHPVNVETVSWTSERKNLLAAIFFLLSFCFYIDYACTRHGRAYLISLLCFLLSILAKASTVVGPLVFLTYEYSQGNRKLRALHLYDKIPFIIAAEALTFFSIHAARAGSAFNSYHQGGPLLSLMASGNLFVEYLKLLFCPLDLTALIYPRVFPSYGNVRLWLELAVVVGVLLVLFFKSRSLFFWAGFFVLFLIPVMNIVPLPIMMANRYLYISQIGIWVLFSVIAIELYSRMTCLGGVRIVVGLAFGLWMMLLPVQTFLTARIWRNSYTLWTDTIERNYFDAVAHYNLGLYFHDHQMSNLSGHEYLTATMINPFYANALTGLGGYYFEKGKVDLALKKLYVAWNAAPDSDIITNNLGKVLAEKGDGRRALFMFFRAHYLNPKNLGTLINISELYLRSNQIDAALEIANTMVKQFPESPDGYFRLGICREARGDLKGAIEAWCESKKRLGAGNPLARELETRLTSAAQKLSPQIVPERKEPGS